MVRLNLLLLVVLAACALGLVTSQHRARRFFGELEQEQERSRQLGVEYGQLQLEAHSLINLLIGGLFAVIALNLSVNTRYVALSSGDNLVSRLLALSYCTLGMAFLINLLLVRFRVMEQLFGRWPQEQTYLVLRWAFPVLVLTMAGAMILSAVA